MPLLNERLARAIFDTVRSRVIASARASLDFGSIGAGLQVVLTVTVAGALLGDFVQWGVETALEAGIEVTVYVSATDTVTVIASNNTAAAIDPAAKFFQVQVSRRS